MESTIEIISSELKKSKRTVEITKNDLLSFYDRYSEIKSFNEVLDAIKEDGNEKMYNALMLDRELAFMNQKLLEEFIMSNSDVRSEYMFTGVTSKEVMERIEAMYNKRALEVRESINAGSYYSKKIIRVGGYDFSVDFGMPLQVKNDTYILCLKKAISNVTHVEVDSKEFNRILREACTNIVIKDNNKYNCVDRDSVKILNKIYRY